MNKSNPGEIFRHIPSDKRNALVGSGLQAARSQVDGLINQAVDRLAALVPGGEQYTPQARQAIKSALDVLQQQLEQEAIRRLGS